MGLLAALLGLLSAAAVLLLRGGGAGSSSHSLRIFYTLVLNSSQDVPQYMVVEYVDDQITARFDPPTRRMLPQVAWLRDLEEEEPHFWDLTSQRARTTERSLSNDLVILHSHHNSSKGFHTWQRMIGCELRKDGGKWGYYRYGYDGEDFISLDQETLTWTAADVRAQVIKRSWEAEPFIAQSRNHFLQKECIELLQKCMKYGKDSLLRTEPPVVKVTHRIHSRDLEIFFCQAYGFYPKKVEITWRKEGKVLKNDTFQRGVLPNSDGTYHAWLSIDIDPKERSHYWCYVEHAGLPEPLIVSWEEPAFVPRKELVAGVAAGVVAVVVAAVFLATRANACAKKHSGDAYTVASTSSQDFQSPPVVHLAGNNRAKEISTKDLL